MIVLAPFSPHFAEMARQERRHRESASRNGDPAAESGRSARPEKPDQDETGRQIRVTPKRIRERRRFANARRRGEWRLKRAAAHAFDEMRDAIGEQRAGDEFKNVDVPRHRQCPLGYAGESRAQQRIIDRRALGYVPRAARPPFRARVRPIE